MMNKHNYLNFILFLSSKRHDLFQEFKKSEEIKELMKHEKVSTFFQPILSLEDGSTVGFEILNRPYMTKLFPTTESFYNYVGRSSNVVLIEHFLRELSLARYSEQVQQLNENTNQLVFLNIQSQVLADPSYRSGKTLELLEKYNLSPKNVVLELTEKEAVLDYNRFEIMINHYRKQGFRIAVDDAGTGYNSLQTLINIKPEFIKIDKSLVRNINTHPEQQYLVEILLRYSLQTETKVIAEGIETKSEFNYLKDLGVHLGQGYALGKPFSKPANGKLPL
ncbi:EAL domain-containing protein [Litchfieldia alkalitelluris]|uniref:EAL domain-containing protein n=1 Tax=Litchfieldia alkalitelluris TaxID=304268 RepID=UPI0011175401|nr:EAL domain-containing protein [Litchfieldia alkalitelluris]